MRLDSFLVKNKYFKSRTKAQQSIEKGEVFIDGKNILKASFEIDEDKPHEIKRDFLEDFVSLGGFKLSKALKEFHFSVKDLICADIGASTGGFTDCLLQNEAKKVYSIDLNDELLDKKLKQNEKVIELIKNAKELNVNDFEEELDFICADLSFISEKLILPVISNLLGKGKHAIILIKPQFELQKKIKLKNGVIKDKKLISSLVENVINFAVTQKLYPIAITNAPNSQEKNREYLVLFCKDIEKILK